VQGREGVERLSNGRAVRRQLPGQTEVLEAPSGPEAQAEVVTVRRSGALTEKPGDRRVGEVVVGVGHRHPHPKDKIGLPFVAHFAEVEVDTRTGEVRVLRLLGAHDSGRVMSPLSYENQVFGGMTMGIGFAMTEARILDRNTGRMVNANWHDYKLPTAQDVPAKPVCVPIDPHDTEVNTVGAKGIGEPATIPTAAAIANAVHHATGVRITEPSINPVQMAQKLWARR